jgi:hypothetical protein
MTLVKSLYVIPTWTRTVALVREHPTLTAVIAADGQVPTHWACYRFLAKLREHAPILERCIADVIRALKKGQPAARMGRGNRRVGYPAYAKGVKADELETEGCSDPDASWDTARQSLPAILG